MYINLFFLYGYNPNPNPNPNKKVQLGWFIGLMRGPKNKQRVNSCIAILPPE